MKMKFLKPTIEKVILFIILLFIGPIVDVFIIGRVSIFTKITNVLFFPAKYFYVQGFSMFGDLGSPPPLYWWVITLIIGLIWGYFLSCLIIYLYQRVKK